MSQYVNLAIDFNDRTDVERKVLREFSKPLFENRLFKNKEALKRNSEEIEFNQDSYTFNPQKLSLDQYGEKNFFKVIMLVNDISSIFSFKRENFEKGKILIPTRSSITKILSYK